MQEFSTGDLWLSFLITWIVVFMPPVLIRAILGRPIGKKPAIGFCVVFYFINVILFTVMGSQSKSHTALFLGAWVSYYIFRWQTNSSATRSAREERKSRGYDE